MAVPTRRGGWVFNRNLWIDLSLKLENLPGSRVKFLPHERHLVPDRSGVYVICLAPFSTGRSFIPKLYDAVYVGQAVNLRRRFGDHLEGTSSVGEVLKAFPNSLDFYFVEIEKSKLDEFERHMYSVLGPSANKVSPPMRASLGEPLPINP